MIFIDNFRILSDEEMARYKFEFCQGCALYDECELVEEYARFRENHSPTPKSKIPQTPGSVPKVKATVVRIGNRKIVPLEPEADPAVVGKYGMGMLSYDKEELKGGCFMSYRHVYPIACGEQRVTEGIGNHYRIETRKDSSIVTNTSDRWEPSQPVFISAQTGRGKNYFIENELIPYVEDLNYKNTTKHRVLILSNRLALRQQIEDRLKGNDDADAEEGKIYHYREYVDVMTYQSLLQREGYLKKIQSKAQSMYIYVICDEAHFFTSDAMFNPHTSKILSAIVRLFQDAVRVYMSATPYECLEYIIKYEREYWSRLSFNRPQEKDKSIRMVFYHFKRDYSYLDVKTYSHISELYEQIVESVNNRNEKWLIFVDDKQKGAKIRGKLLEYEKQHAKERGWSLLLNGGAEESAEGGNGTDSEAKDRVEIQAKRILAVNAGSKANETFMSIIRNEAVGNDTYVLITTSVLDNGVNLMGIENVVISDMAKVKCLQMLGRARVNGAGDRKTLYIQRFSGSDVGERMSSLDRQKVAYHKYNLAYGESRDWCQSREDDEQRFLEKYYDGSDKDREDAKHWFGRSLKKPTELYFNEIAKSLLDRLIPQYEAIYAEINTEGLQEDGAQHKGRINYTGQKYLEYQLSWFGKTYCVDDDITFVDKDRAKKNLIAFLEKYVMSGEKIDSEDKMASFTAKFTKLYDATYPKAAKDKARVYGHKKMNDLLKERGIGYEITGQPQKGPWTVVSANSPELH